MAVARDDLGGDVLAPQPEPLHHPRLDRGRDRGVGADRAGELAEGELLEGVGEAVEVAVGLEGEAGEAQAEGGRLGVDAVGAPDAERVAVLQRPLDQRVAVGARAGEDDLAGLAQLQRERRVEHVGGGQAVVDPAAVLADRGGDDVDEGGDVVVGDPLPLVDRLDREGGVGSRRLGGLARARRPPRPRPRSPPARPRASTPSCAAGSRPRPISGGCSAGSSAVDDPRREHARRSSPRRSRRRRPGSRAASAPRRAARRGRRGSCRGSARRSPAGRCGRRRRPGSAADIPAPAMITFSPRIRAFVQYSRTISGSRWALITRTS